MLTLAGRMDSPRTSFYKRSTFVTHLPVTYLYSPSHYWLALEPGGDRLVITGYGALNTRVRFATIDRRTGKLTLEPSSIDFTRAWPDGWQGSAIPHGAVFSNP